MSEYRRLVEAAEAGDVEAARALLQHFSCHVTAGRPAPPAILEYLAAAFDRITGEADAVGARLTERPSLEQVEELVSEPLPGDANAALNLIRPRARPSTPETVREFGDRYIAAAFADHRAATGETYEDSLVSVARSLRTNADRVRKAWGRHGNLFKHRD